MPVRFLTRVRRYRVWLVLGAWALLAAGFWLVASQRDQTPVELLVDALRALQTSPVAVLWLLLIYLIRPFFLLPVSVLTVFAGFMFDAFYGTIWSIFASVGSAALAYGLARFLSSRRRVPQAGLGRRLHENAFEAVLTMRLASMPGDPINFLCGAMRVPIWPFLLGTLIGGMPGLLIGVFAGASITTPEFTFQGVSIRWQYIAASAVMLVIGLAFSWWLRRRNPQHRPRLENHDLENHRDA